LKDLELVPARALLEVALAANLGPEELHDHLPLGIRLELILDPVGDPPDDLLVTGIVHDDGDIDLGASEGGRSGYCKGGEKDHGEQCQDPACHR
jgi:hypothetical protein